MSNTLKILQATNEAMDAAAAMMRWYKARKISPEQAIPKLLEYFAMATGKTTVGALKANDIYNWASSQQMSTRETVNAVMQVLQTVCNYAVYWDEQEENNGRE